MGIVRAAVGIAAPRERVLAAFTHPRALRAWWGADDVRVEPRRGGVFALTWRRAGAGGTLTRAQGSFARLGPDGFELRLRYARDGAEAPATCAVSLGSAGAVTSVLVREEHGEGPVPEQMAREAADAWRNALPRLKSMLEGDALDLGFGLRAPPAGAMPAAPPAPPRRGAAARKAPAARAAPRKRAASGRARNGRRS